MANRTLNSRLGRLWDRTLGVPITDQTTGRKRANLSRAQQYVLDKAKDHPWDFLTARDPANDRPLIWTKDEADKSNPIKPFPSHLEYVKEYLEILMNEKFVLVDKARQMYVTTATLLFVHWYCLFNRARRCVLSKNKEQEAFEILSEKIRFPHSQMPLWAQAALPISRMPKKVIKYKATDSQLIGTTQNVAETEARGGTVSIMIVDEAARQAKFAAIVAAIIPALKGTPGVTGGQLFGMTTPDIGSPGSVDFKAYLDDTAA